MADRPGAGRPASDRTPAGGSATDGSATDRLRDWLRLRIELGEPDLFLDGSTRADLLARVRRAASSPPAAGSSAAAASAGAAVPSAGSPAATAAGSPAATAGGALEHLRRGASAQEIEALPDLAALRSVAAGCVRCPLHATRRNVVFADGSPRARVMCVGEAPGAREDETGLPFVGRAGRLLDRLLLSVGFPREEVYICNVLKCRPPGNRNPEPEEIERCSPFLRRQVELVAPEVIVAFGTFAARTLLDSRDALGRLRGRVHRYQGRPLVVTYHPAALLRNPGWRRPTWEDLQLVRGIADRGEGGLVSEAAGG